MTNIHKDGGRKKTVRAWAVVDEDGFGWYQEYGKSLLPQIFLSLGSAENEASALQSKWGIWATKIIAVPITVTYTLPAKRKKK